METHLDDEFVGIVAHDLKSPMTVIRGFAELLRTQWEELPSEERSSLLLRIEENIQRMSDLIDDVLQLAQISRGSAEDLQPFDMGELIERTVEEIRATDLGRRYDVVIEPDLPKVMGDEERSWRVLTNLLSNASKFSEDVIEINARREKDEVVVSVRDRGTGIAPDDMPLLFRRFSRVPARGEPHALGTGLGLYIAKSLVEAQNGHIWVDSKPGVGSTFSFSVPVAGTAA